MCKTFVQLVLKRLTAQETARAHTYTHTHSLTHTHTHTHTHTRTHTHTHSFHACAASLSSERNNINLSKSALPPFASIELTSHKTPSYGPDSSSSVRHARTHATSVFPVRQVQYFAYTQKHKGRLLRTVLLVMCGSYYHEKFLISVHHS
jgi:hypothetical protein